MFRSATELLQTTAIGSGFVLGLILIAMYGILTAVATDDVAMWALSVEQVKRDERTSLDTLGQYQRSFRSWAEINLTGRFGAHLALDPLEHHKGRHAIDGRELVRFVDWNGFTDEWAQLVGSQMADAATR